MADGEIILGVDIDARKAKEKIQKLVNELAKLKIDNSNISIKLREIEREAYRCEQHILRLKNALKNANDKTVIDSINQEIKASENYIKTLTDEYSKVLAKKLEIKEAIKEINKEIGNVRKEKIDALEESHRRAEQAARKHAQAESEIRENLSKASENLNEVRKNFNKIINSSPIQFSWNKILKPPIQFSWDKILKPSLNGLKSSFGNALNWLKSASSHDFAPDLNDYKIAFNEHFFEPLIKPIYQRCLPAFQNLGKGFSWVKDRLSGLGQGFSWIKGHFVNAANSIGSVSGTFQNFGNGISRVFSTLSNFGSQALGWISRLTSRIFYLASSAFVFNVISAGFRELSKEVRNLLSQDEVFATSLNNVQANLMTAFYPIYQAALPALRALGEMLSWITAQLAQFIAMLTGTSVSANQQGAKQMYIKSSLGNKANTRAYNTHLKSQGRADKVKASNAFKSVNYANKITKPKNNVQENIVKPIRQAYNNAGKSAEDNSNKLAKFDKAAKKSRKELAKFDKIEVLKQDKIKPDNIKKLSKELNKVKMPKEPKLPEPPKLREIPEVEPFIPKMPALEGFSQNLDTKLSPFFENILKWIERLKKPLESISFENLNRELGELWGAVSKFGGTIGEGLFWFYEKVLVPLSKWVIEDILPSFLKILTSCLKVIEPILKTAGKQLAKLYDTFLKPVAEWTGDKISKFLKKLAGWIEDIGNKTKDNKHLLEFISAFLIGLGAAKMILGLGAFKDAIVKLTTKIWALVTANWAWVTSTLANPTTWITLGIGLLIAALILCITHFDDLKAAGERFVNWIKGELPKVGEWLYKYIGRPIEGIVNFIRSLFGQGPISLEASFKSFGFNHDFDKYKREKEKYESLTPEQQEQIKKDAEEKIKADLKLKRFPKLAQGSVLKGGNPFLAWVNDQPRGQTNVETPLDTIVKAFKAVSGNNGNQNIVIEASGDINSIIREFNFRLKNENKRIGTEIMVPSGAL